MTRIGLTRQVDAVALAHAGARDQLALAERAGRFTDTERRIKRQHVLALRAARETLLTLVRQEKADSASGAAKVRHDAMVAGSLVPDFTDQDAVVMDAATAPNHGDAP